MIHILLVITLFATWSLSFPLGKMLVSHASPMLVTGLRMGFAGLCLLMYLYFKKGLPKGLGKKEWVSLILLGLVSIFFTNVLEFYSLQKLSSSKVCFLYSLSPFLTALFSYLHFKEKMTRKKWLGMGVAFASIMIGFLDSLSLNKLHISFSLADFAMLLAVIFSVYGWILLRILVKNSISHVFANGISMLIGGSIALFVSGVSEPSLISTLKNLHPAFYLTIILITIISNFICYNLYGHLLKRFTATFMSFFGLLSPLFATIHGFFILNETPNLPILLSTPCILLGLFIFYQEELRQGYIVKKP
jgi:drug/metabolite transporter (DMT)-like permease